MLSKGSAKRLGVRGEHMASYLNMLLKEVRRDVVNIYLVQMRVQC